MPKVLIIAVFYGALVKNDVVDKLNNSVLEDKGVL